MVVPGMQGHEHTAGRIGRVKHNDGGDERRDEDEDEDEGNQRHRTGSKREMGV